MNVRRKADRRTVLKTLGAGVVGSVAFAGASSAGDTGDERRQDSFTWAQGDLYEMLESEPPGVRDLEPGKIDDEGAHESHRPLWVIAATGKEHSPHPNPDGLPIDHVVPLVDFSAQWHVTLVIDPSTDELTNSVGDDLLLSADAITTAAENGDVVTAPLFTPEGEPAVFTCPIRPHRH